MKTTLRTAFASFAVAVSLAAPLALAQTAAPDPAALQAAREMLAAMHYEQTAALMMRQMSAQMPQLIQQSAAAAIQANPKLTEEQRKKALDEMAVRAPHIADTVTKAMSDPAMINEMVGEIAPLYARHFTAAELRQLADFYRTPLGAKMLAELPQIAAESIQISQRVMIPRMQSMVRELVKDTPAP